MKDYLEQFGCHSCGWVFKKRDYDEPTTYYCNNHDAGSRPLCLSNKMNEVPNGADYNTMFDLWWDWAEKREVKPYGICKQWRYRDEV